MSTNSILTALSLCVKNNFFTFNNKIYKQICGVGTGIKLAPTYACLGLGKYEECAFSSDQELLKKIILWKRYIDDVVMLFKGSKEECPELVDWLNNHITGVVKFKFDFSFKNFEFLDLEISVDGGKLNTNIYVKPTNKQLFLDFESNHHLYCKE